MSSKAPFKDKRRRGLLSCAECRRLKLRCDRVFPCESCTKRGCAAICPEGALTTKGTRFVLANTEMYHEKISEMSDRIRQLEDCLAEIHQDVSHPLLREDLLLIKVPVELSNKVDKSSQLLQQSTTVVKQEEASPPLSPEDPNVPFLLNPFGSLKVLPNGSSKFYGQTAHAHFYLKDNSFLDDEPVEPSTLPVELQYISNGFLASSSSMHRDTSLIQMILDYLPSADELRYLVDLYYSHASWLYEPCVRVYFQESFDHVLQYANDPSSIRLDRLALVFATISHGALVDLKQKPYNIYALELHQLARATLSLTPFIEEPTLPCIQTLFLLGLFSVLSNKKNGSNQAWLIHCLACKLAQTLGLHRDLDHWDHTDKAEANNRRRTFWELITLEGWLSLGVGRPTATDLSEVYCKMPVETQQAMSDPDNKGHVWHTWKHVLARYVARVLKKTLSVKTPPYIEILELDRSIQAFKMPPHSAMQVSGIAPPPPEPYQVPGLNMQRALLIQAHSTALLLLHRGFFGRALEEEKDPMQSRFAPSVYATYTSAWRTILSLDHAYSLHPELTRRFGLLWSNSFSASISLCLLVIRATRSSYASGAFQGLNLVYSLFESAAAECFPASNAFPVMKRLREKAIAAYEPYVRGHPSSEFDLDRRDSNDDDDDDDQDVRVLGGKTHVAQLPVLRSSQSKAHLRDLERLTKSPVPVPTTNHLDNVHPLLLQYVEQSQWVSSNPSEQEAYYPAQPGPSTAPYVDVHPAYYSSRPEMVILKQGQGPIQPPPMQYAEYASYPEPLAYHQTTADMGYWNNDNDTVNSQVPVMPDDQPQQQHYHYADPSLESYTELDQYSAWQTHMKHLGLPY